MPMLPGLQDLRAPTREKGKKDPRPVYHPPSNSRKAWTGLRLPYLRLAGTVVYESTMYLLGPV